LRLQAEEMRRIAVTDSLTGVHSKRYMLDNAEKLMDSKSCFPVWAMLIDIDNLTDINKSLGYLTGDHILAAVGDLLNRNFHEQCMVVRFGGEEFAILLSRMDAGEVQQRAEALRRQVEQLQPTGVDITISVGLASNIDHPEIDLNSLITHADRALAAAKSGGRNRYCIYAGDSVEFSSPSSKSAQNNKGTHLTN
jgi:two-component system cell cycle response regulator